MESASLASRPWGRDVKASLLCAETELLFGKVVLSWWLSRGGWKQLRYLLSYREYYLFFAGNLPMVIYLVCCF